MNEARFTEIETFWIGLSSGTRLAARLWLPADADKHPAPAVLEFLPYRRRDVTAPRDESTYPGFAEAGIAGVRVDMQGSGDSDGLFDDEYSEQELSDAEEVIAWIANQPWCNGSVGMMGISWGGFNGLQVAARKPPALKAIISIASSIDRFADDIHYRGGCHLSAQLYWSTTMLGYISRPPDSEIVGESWRAMWMQRLNNLTPLIMDWLEHPTRDAFWRHGSVIDQHASYDIPSMLIAGIADGYRNTPSKALAAMPNHVRAITGPWIHKYPHFAWPRPRIDFVNMASRWWRHWLINDGKGEDWPAHRLYRSENVRPGGTRSDEPGQWIELTDEPGETLCLYPSADGSLNETAAGETSLTLRSPADCGAEGGEFFTVNNHIDLADDQRSDDQKSLCFQTEPFASPFDLVGRPVLTLELTSDQPLGNIVARLCDVHEDGTSHRVSMGVLNLAHREGSQDPMPMPLRKPVTVSLEMDVACYRFLKGHRLKLALSTHYFPMILPPPQEMTATLALGSGCALELPCKAYRDVDFDEPADPSPLPRYPTKALSDPVRVVEQDDDGLTVIRTSDDTGEVTHPTNGMVWQERKQSVWRVRPDEGGSFHGFEELDVMRRRDGIETRCVAQGELHADQTHWHVRASMVAHENGKVVFEKQWKRSIARYCM